MRTLLLCLWALSWTTAWTQSLPYHRDTVHIVCGADTLRGVYLQPTEEGPFPAVLCLQGGGDVGLENYLFEAKAFAEWGYAALVCDKAGAGESRGPSFWGSQTFSQKLDEYACLHVWLQSREAVDPDRVGLHGMSEGGRLALALALRRGAEVAFVNAVSGPVNSLKEGQLYAIRHFMEARGRSPELIERSLRLWAQWFDHVANRHIPEAWAAEAAPLHAEADGLYLPPADTALPQRPQPEDVYFELDGALDSLACPLLFQYGDQDGRVDFAECLRRIPLKENFAIRLYEATDHNMNRDGELHPGYLSDKAVWLEAIEAKATD